MLMAILEALNPPNKYRCISTPESGRERMFRTRVGPFGLTSLGRRALANCVGKLAFTLIAKSTSSDVLFLFQRLKFYPAANVM